MRYKPLRAWLFVFTLVTAVFLRTSDTVFAQGNPKPDTTSLNGPGNVFLTATLAAASNCRTSASNQFAIADFNEDGKLDLAIPDHGCSTGMDGVGIHLGNGDGTFQASVETPDLGGAQFVAVGDFNGDGKKDLAVVGALNTNLTVPAVYILLGNGDGTFTVKTTLTGFTGSQSLVLGDFNGDGKLDIAVIDTQVGTSNPSSVIVYLGNGDGTVQSPITTTNFGTTSALNAASGDFNKDGKLDLVLTDGGNRIIELLGNGDGTFQAARSFSWTANAGGYGVAVGDFNGDGIPDVAATSPTNGAVNIFLGIGDGTFHAPTIANAFVPAGGPTFLALGDFNKDGKIDIVTGLGGINTSATVCLILGNGDGTFSAPTFFSVDSFPAGIVAADLNNDGNLDWVVGSTVSTRVTVGLGDGKGGFQSARSYPDFVSPNATSNVGPSAAMLGDFNNDGKLDMVAVNAGTSVLSIFLGNGDGTFQPAASITIPPITLGEIQNSLVIGDFNKDGNLDVVTSSSSTPGAIRVLLGKGDGTFQAPMAFPTGGSGGGFILAADFNGDGKLDIAVVNESDNTVSILLGNGDGTFQAGKITSALASDGFIGVPTVADFNGDGKLDLAVPDYVGSLSGKVAILLGKGDGTFQAPAFITTSGGATGSAAADFNKDGKVDLVTANQFGTVNVFLGNGDGTFNTPSVTNLSGQPVDRCSAANPIPILVVTGDFNLDGNVDFLVGNHLTMVSSAYPCLTSQINVGMALFLGNGDGTFQPFQNYMMGGSATWLAVGDLDGNGSPDVAADAGGDQVINILLNQTPPPVIVSPKSLAFANQLVGTSSATQPIAVKNNGGATAALTVRVSGDFTETDNCASLAPASSCTINVAFKPATTGQRIGSLTISYNLPGSPQIVALSGTGVAPAVTLSPANVNFSGQLVTTSSTAQAVTLTNSGTATLNIAGIAITGPNSVDFSQTNTCGATLAPNASCTVGVTFKPTATGNRAASVTFTDDAAGSPQSVAVTGTGTDFSIDAESGGSTSATVNPGQTATYSLQVTPISGFNGTVALTCAGAPSEATCALSTNSATPNGASAAPFTATVTTTTPSVIPPRNFLRRWPPVNPFLLIVPLLILLTQLAMRARIQSTLGSAKFKLASNLVPATALLLMVLAGGCGGGGGGGTHNPGTPGGTYTLTITGTSGGVSHTQKLTLTVN